MWPFKRRKGHDCIQIANHLLSKAYVSREKLTSVQVLKLVYLAHAWKLAIYGEPMIRQTVMAWEYGPVIEKLYKAVAKYGSGAVDDPIETAAWSYYYADLSPQDRDILNQVWDRYSGFSGVELCSICHKSGTPWTQVAIGDKIPNELIESCYRGFLEEVK